MVLCCIVTSLREFHSVRFVAETDAVLGEAEADRKRHASRAGRTTRLWMIIASVIGFIVDWCYPPSTSDRFYFSCMSTHHMTLWGTYSASVFSRSRTQVMGACSSDRRAKRRGLLSCSAVVGN
ncbi:hypothetical protein BV898_17328 [Hypsibius exemplaris]|uniref:Uncharacterized protein n=1 Tax=Hypsibius exemplaris TaxID=2072580 RepID=A0A9X6NM20_HYPEX|nr:hypothetical protein BV898_17328 [Hypsibius exemplaris]